MRGVEADIEEHTQAGMTDPEIAAIIFREVSAARAPRPSAPRAIAGYLGHLDDAVTESTATG